MKELNNADQFVSEYVTALQKKRWNVNILGIFTEASLDRLYHLYLLQVGWEYEEPQNQLYLRGINLLENLRYCFLYG